MLLCRWQTSREPSCTLQTAEQSIFNAEKQQQARCSKEGDWEGTGGQHRRPQPGYRRRSQTSGQMASCQTREVPAGRLAPPLLCELSVFSAHCQLADLYLVFDTSFQNFVSSKKKPSKGILAMLLGCLHTDLKLSQLNEHGLWLG